MNREILIFILTLGLISCTKEKEAVPAKVESKVVKVKQALNKDESCTKNNCDQINGDTYYYLYLNN